MALPPGVPVKTVTFGIASFFDGSLADGTVTITAPVNVIHTPTNRPIFSSAISQRFVDGAASFNLCPTDADGLNRVDWTYKANITVQGALVQPDPIYFTLPTAGPDTIDLDGLVTVPSSAGIPISVEVLTADELDPYTADFVADPTSATAAALRAAFVRPLGCKTVWLGDSITNYSGGLVSNDGVLTQGFTDSKGLHAWANVLLNHGMDAVNAGKGGDWTAGMVDRFAADVATYDPALVIILGGTNDISNAVDTATTIANLTSLYQSSLALGARVLACTIPPNSVWTTAQCQQALAINAWMRSYCRTTRGLSLADIGAAVADPATTYQYLAGHTVEGTHPNTLGATKMGRVLAKALAGLVPTTNDALGLANGELGNLLANPLFVGSGTSLPTGWDASGGLGSSTVDYLPSTDGLAVPWLRLTVPNGSGLTIQQNIAPGAGSVTVGSNYTFAVEIAVDSQDSNPAAATQAVLAVLQSYNGSSFTAKAFDMYWDGSYVNAPFPGASGVLMTAPLTVPADSVVVQAAITLGGGGVYRVRRAALRAA